MEITQLGKNQVNLLNASSSDIWKLYRISNQHTHDGQQPLVFINDLTNINILKKESKTPEKILTARYFNPKTHTPFLLTPSEDVIHLKDEDKKNLTFEFLANEALAIFHTIGLDCIHLNATGFGAMVALNMSKHLSIDKAFCVAPPLFRSILSVYFDSDQKYSPSIQEIIMLISFEKNILRNLPWGVMLEYLKATDIPDLSYIDQNKVKIIWNHIKYRLSINPNDYKCYLSAFLIKKYLGLPNDGICIYDPAVFHEYPDITFEKIPYPNHFRTQNQLMDKEALKYFYSK